MQENVIVDVSDMVTLVAVTAYTDVHTINHCYRVGMSEVLLKPCNRDKLQQVLNKYYLV